MTEKEKKDLEDGEIEDKTQEHSKTPDPQTGQVVVKKKSPKDKKEIPENKTSTNGLDMKDFSSETKDLSGFNMSDYNTSEEEIEVTEKVITSITVDKPSKQAFVKIHPTMVAEIDIVKFDEEKGRAYLVHKDAMQYVVGHAIKVKVYPYITLKGNLGLLPITQAKPGKKMLDWHLSREKMVVLGRKSWIQMRSKSEGAGYDAIKPKKPRDPPEWPDLTLPEILEIAFSDYIIRDKDHPVVKMLQGA